MAGKTQIVSTVAFLIATAIGIQVFITLPIDPISSLIGGSIGLLLVHLLTRLNVLKGRIFVTVFTLSNILVAIVWTCIVVGSVLLLQ